MKIPTESQLRAAVLAMIGQAEHLNAEQAVVVFDSMTVMQQFTLKQYALPLVTAVLNADSDGITITRPSKPRERLVVETDNECRTFEIEDDNDGFYVSIQDTVHEGAQVTISVVDAARIAKFIEGKSVDEPVEKIIAVRPDGYGPLPQAAASFVEHDFSMAHEFGYGGRVVGCPPNCPRRPFFRGDKP